MEKGVYCVGASTSVLPEVNTSSVRTVRKLSMRKNLQFEFSIQLAPQQRNQFEESGFVENARDQFKLLATREKENGFPKKRMLDQQQEKSSRQERQKRMVLAKVQ
ncbi:hypothetical protein OPV22_035126 [Ensete ventricosum]|uniref:Uncharacterized protein n=1 Tax=Ensete ventricosum TaxID=4639 RepID=A0AAX5NIG3_ENSVE|nr:hypothetical protein OPV22_035126 [Ensete ventricosum]RWW26399.1 hypothetical protein GW17_00009213 [Ensete ventricosum]RWW80870.1 hypothetical protein BHE74_00010769 [Ensete ventricosum]RZS28599.1 hypothetical protein BHM03_00062216 [Ensete ventricosum]